MKPTDIIKGIEKGMEALITKQVDEALIGSGFVRSGELEIEIKVKVKEKI